jgi:transketolase
MRNAFIKRLLQLAATNPKLFLITGDLGFGVLDEFEKKFPNQFLNVGVAEQNMTAVATGLALEGYIVFTYSIGNFPTLRCLEQIRNDVCYHEANVKVVSVGGGLSYGQLGMSHHATEDLSIIRALPNIVVCAPGGAHESALAVDAVIAHQGPAYLRLERAAADVVENTEAPFEFGRARVLREGDDMTLIACGGVVAETVAAADLLAEQNIRCRVLSMHTVKPFDAPAVLAAAKETGGICTIEENTLQGGLGGAVAEVCMDHRIQPKHFRRLGIKDTFVSTVGDQAYLRTEIGLDRQAIAATVRNVLEA